MLEAGSENKTVREKVIDVVDEVSIPTAAFAGAYVFNAKTGDALYDNLKATGKLADVSNHGKIFKAHSYGSDTAKELTKFHANWTKAYNAKLQEYGFTNIFKRFGGIHHNQKLEVVVQTITTIGMVIGFGALLDQLKRVKGESDDKSISR